MSPPQRLRDLIRSIRASKIAADEREVITKECAMIRTDFKKDDEEYRGRNVSKLLYIHMLGYPAHFGQLECLKLVASVRFSDKRIGYLGVNMLLDERTDVHILVTNSLKNDMNHSNQYVVGLALATLGNICSPEMARDLASEVEKLVKSSNSYIRKKAALCAARIVQRVPEMIDNFVPLSRALLNERNHGVLLTAVTLITELCKHSTDTLGHFRRIVPNLVRILKNLVLSGFAPEYDVSGITDPFLQVKIIRLLRVLGHNDSEASDSMNDILAQVATNTESAKNVGNAILYETVLAIMDIEAESGLRVLAVNILGKFLVSVDKNIRYIALNTLLKTVTSDNAAVQRHRNTVLDCLKDSDVSIRRRALELTFSLINISNIRGLIRELLTFLEEGGQEFKAELVSGICLAAERYAPSKRWHIDTVLTVLQTGGNMASDNIVTSFIVLISSSPEFHAYATQRLYKCLLDDIIQQPLTQIGMWCIGEFADLLLSGVVEEEVPINVKDEDIVDITEAILKSPHSNEVTRAFTITALMKLTARSPHSSQNSRIQQLISTFSTSLNVELQQRSIEFGALFSMPTLRPQLLERMPPMETLSNSHFVDGENNDLPSTSLTAVASTATAPLNAESTDKPSLLDLLDAPAPMGNGGGSMMSGNSGSTVTQNHGGDLLDLLQGDLMGDIPPALMSSSAAAPVSSTIEVTPADLLMESQTKPSVVAYSKNGLMVTFFLERASNNPTVVHIHVESTNSSSAPLDEFSLQAAVPKSLKLQIQPPSGSRLTEYNGRITQLIKIANPTNAVLRVRLRISFTCNGNAFTEQADVSDFPHF